MRYISSTIFENVVLDIKEKLEKLFDILGGFPLTSWHFPIYTNLVAPICIIYVYFITYADRLDRDYYHTIYYTQVHTVFFPKSFTRNAVFNSR